MLNRTLCVVALAASSLLTACGADTVARTGFIPKSVPMSKVDGDTSSYKAKGFELSQFGKVVVEPIQGPPTNEDKIEPKDMEDLPVVVLATREPAYEKTLGNMEEVRARGGQVGLIKIVPIGSPCGTP